MRSIANRPALRRAYARLRFGDLRRIEPLSSWGNRRGLPIDRWYIERFLAEQVGVVHGHALEVKSDSYATRFGATSVDVVDIDRHNPLATIVGDLCRPATLAPKSYDVEVITQTLPLVTSPSAAVQHLVEALRPGGRLLITVPMISRIIDASDRWRWTPLGLRELLESAVPPGTPVECTGYGNGLAARAFLFGLAAEDLGESALVETDENFPMLVAARVGPVQ